MIYLELIKRRCATVSSYVGNIVGSIIQSITVLIFIKKIMYPKNSKKFITIEDVILFLIFTVVISLIYGAEYNGINPLAFFIIMVLGLVFIYKFNFSKSFLCSGLFMVFLFLSDLIVSIIFVCLSTIETIRSNLFYMIISNLSVGTIEIGLISIKKVKNKLIAIIESNENKKSVEVVAFITLLIAALCISIYVLSENYTPSKMFLAGIIAVVIFMILTLIFFKEKYEKDKIVNRYDQLFEYVQTFEEWMDNESMNIHESKNQLATLRDIVKRNKKAVEYIDDIIKERINTEGKNFQKLKYIPKGGLKGLLYYKITIAENNDISLFIDVSKDIGENLVKLNIDENKMLCRFVGIFFDNAIEAAKDSQKKMISCEIYVSGGNIIIAISNTFSGTVELEKVNQNGYSTKGKGRGKGLYLANKFSKNYDVFSLESRIINDYYVQKITIKKI